MLEDYRLKVFIAVAENCSFTKAAEALGVSQPAVSQNIAELEKTVGERLFERMHGEVALTPQGKIFLGHARKILSSYQTLSDTFEKVQPSTVRISVSEDIYTYIISPLLESFVTVHPDVLIERAMFDDADLRIILAPSSDSVFDVPSDSISRIRLTTSQPPKMGDYKAAHEKSLYFDLLFQPSPVFGCTRLCRLLKEYLIYSL